MEKKQTPNKEITEYLISATKEEIKKHNVKFHNVPNFSIDTVFAQLFHIDEILKMDCKTIEMETAVLFKAAQVVQINTTALFCVSDSTVASKSLYSGRSDAENEYRHQVRFNVIPYILFNTFGKMKN